jgi:hypothetical protein
MGDKKYRLGSDAAYGQHISATTRLEWIEPPEGVLLRHDEDRLIWAQWTMSRLVEDWTVSDLSQLGKVIKQEIDLRHLWNEYHSKEMMVVDEMGERTLNPQLEILLKHIDPIQKQQLSIIRSMGLNTPSTDPRTMARAVENVRNHQATAEKNKGSLLAQPH